MFPLQQAEKLLVKPLTDIQIIFYLLTSVATYPIKSWEQRKIAEMGN